MQIPSPPLVFSGCNLSTFTTYKASSTSGSDKPPATAQDGKYLPDDNRPTSKAWPRFLLDCRMAGLSSFRSPSQIVCLRLLVCWSWQLQWPMPRRLLRRVWHEHRQTKPSPKKNTQRRRDKAKNERIQKGRGAVARKPRHLKEIQDLKEAMARLEAQLLECRREKEASTVNRHSFSQQIQGVGLQQPEGLNQPVDNTEPLQEAFTPEQAVLVQRQLAERDQLHQQAMQELIDSRHVQLQQVVRDTRQVCSAEKRSLEDLLKSKDLQLKQESRKKQRTHQPRPRQQTSSPKNAPTDCRACGRGQWDGNVQRRGRSP